MTDRSYAPGMTGLLYPCYVDLDDFIDLPWLQSLDDFIHLKLRSRLRGNSDLKFYTGPFILDEALPKLPGSQMVYLSEPKGEDDYYRLDEPEFWERGEAADEFAPLMDFIDTLPFETTARMLIMYDEHGAAVSAHRDHERHDLCHEFIWFRTNLEKPFYMLDQLSGERLYVRSHSAWFDTVNQFHGADATGTLSFSIRVDGKFTDDFRRQIPFPEVNLAAAPAMWAAKRSSGVRSSAA